MSVDFSKIRTDGGTQARACLNDQTVAEYAEAMADENTVFPPITLYFDGKDYWLADGFHRLAAWHQIGRTDIPADVRQGDRRRAILHSVAANSAHGLRRTNEDKRRAVLTLLDDEEWSQWSDREIARKCAVSPSFVGAIRGASVHGGQIAETRTVQRNGATYQQKTAKIGEKPRASPVDVMERERPSKGAPVKKSDPVRYLAEMMLYATDDWDRLAAALYQVSTAEIRDIVLEAIAENEANDGA